MSWIHEAKMLLNRRGLRLALAPVVSRMARARREGVERIFCDDGVWMHQTSRGYFAYREPFVRLNMKRMDAFAQSVFLWGYRPRAADVMVDVGAGVGEEVLIFSGAVGREGKVVCVEAHPETFRCLEKLVQYNRLENVIAIHRAVSEPGCETAMIEDGKHYLRNRLGSEGGLQVGAITLDRLRRELGLERIHFLKMNIEGAERFAIRGMRETLQKTEVCCVCCRDLLADAAGENGLRTRGMVSEFLQENGLRVVERQGAGLAPYVRDQVWGYNDALHKRLAS